MFPVNANIYSVRGEIRRGPRPSGKTGSAKVCRGCASQMLLLILLGVTLLGVIKRTSQCPQAKWTIPKSVTSVPRIHASAEQCFVSMLLLNGASHSCFC